jgi:MFS family permease
MFLGRFIFGCGGESFMVANTAFISNWFEGNELAFAFGINMTTSVLGRIWNNLMSPYLLHLFNDINIPFLFGFFLCLFCNLIIIFSLWIERRIITTTTDMEISSIPKQHDDGYKALNKSLHHGENQSIKTVRYGCCTNGEGEVEMNPLRTEEESSVVNASMPINCDDGSEVNGGMSFSRGKLVEEEVEPIESEEPIPPLNCFYELFNFHLDFWLLIFNCFICYGIVFSFNYISTSLLMERDYFKPLPSSCHLLVATRCFDSVTNPAIDCPIGTNYQPLLPANYSSYNPLLSSDIDCSQEEWITNLCTKEYCQRFITATWYVNSAMSIPYLMTAFTSPFFGYFLDRFGYRGKLNIFFTVLLIIVHCLLAFSNISPILPLVGQGIAFSIGCAVVWSSIPLTVKPHVTGLGFGIATCALNLGTAIIPMIIASVFTSSNDRYIPNVEYFFIFLSLLGLLSCLLLSYYDYSSSGKRNFR